MRKALPLMMIVASSVACGKGALSISAEDSRDAQLAEESDAGLMERVNDSGARVEDGGSDTQDLATDVPRSCDPATCGPGASCDADERCACDDGLLGDPMVECTAANPCEGVDCPEGASCNPDGSCGCDPFFTDDGAGGCAPRPPAQDLTTRSRDEVCAIWTARYERASDDFFMVEPADECDPGVLHPEEMREALHATSAFRMLVGLYPVSTNAGQLANTQACATTHAAQNAGLSHMIPSDWRCYTPEAAAGAGSSNIARGISSPAGTVGLYVGDNGVPSLGHRRWVFNPSMATTAFGHRDAFGCMFAFDRGRSHNPAYVAYPAPGFFPRDALLGKWSVSGGGSWNDGHDVTITNMADGSDVPVTNITAPVFGSLAATLSWSTAANSLPIDAPLQVVITDEGSGTVLEYTTTLIDCP